MPAPHDLVEEAQTNGPPARIPLRGFLLTRIIVCSQWINTRRAQSVRHHFHVRIPSYHHMKYNKSLLLRVVSSSAREHVQYHQASQ